MNAESVAERRDRPVTSATSGAPSGIRSARGRARTAGLAAALAATLLTSACAAGRAAQTADQVPTQDGVNATVGAIALRGLSVDAPASIYYVPGSDVVMNLVLVNTGTTDDTLTSITTSAATSWGSYASVAAATTVQKAANSAALASASPAAAPTSSATATPASTKRGKKSATSTAPAAPKAAQTVLLAAGERVSYGVPDATHALLLLGTKGRLYPGNSITVDFDFAQAGDVKVTVPIQLSAGAGDQSVSAPATDGGE